ncbi:hypothetical protein F4813DRAFT_358361 [Daldinia decipiens]|uniref:uncharacterized protein n=1 Tax=Daldinia decipiens TaxID=326647 RepID=UPI0020C33CD8|nr:uncharacterized protein F4813DRAFT_358361 [Daldinia decipiens]KAI1657905.1 hypothetical protein F4813DRAFT_358361 [Daldinia decipiens]
MTQFSDLEEWKAVQKTCHLVHSAVQDAIGSLPHSSEDMAYLNYLNDLSQEVQMIDISVPLGVYLPTAVVDQCKTQLESLLRLFKQLPGILNLTVPDATRIRSAIAHITDTNRFFTSLGRTTTSSSSFANAPAERNLAKADNTIQVFTEGVLDKLCSLFSECSYQSDHRMMLRFSGLRGLDPTLTTTLHLLLNSCEGYSARTDLWQYITCRYPTIGDAQNPDGQLKILQDLCKNIHFHLHINESLQLRLINGQVFYSNNADGKFTLDNSVPGSSLHDLLKKGYFLPLTWSSTNRLTTWEKRSLALDLGLAFMHLIDCRWTRHRWKTRSLHFLHPWTLHCRDSLLQTPPYLGCNVSVASSTNEEDHDTLFPGHPDFLLFGKLLAELENGEEIEATQCNKHGVPSLYLTLLVGIHEGRLSAHPYYSKAISACLSLYKQPGDPNFTRERIQKTIVLNLNKALASCERPPLPQAKIHTSQARAQPEVNIEHQELSTSLSFEHQMPILPTTPLENQTQEMSHSPKELPDITCGSKRTIASALKWQNSGPSGPLRRSPRLRQLASSKATSSTRESPSLSTHPRGRVSKIRGSRTRGTKSSKLSKALDHLGGIQLSQHKVGKYSSLVRLFDESSDCVDSSKRESAAEFIHFYDNFKRQYGYILNACTSELPEYRISVCIIDTGIDKTHPAIKGAFRRGCIKDCRSWVGNEDDVHDNYGHGTHAAHLILNASENINLYIAKVADGLDIEPHNINKIAEAILYAVTVWDVDILTMSFGFRELEPNIKAAIDEASRRGKLLFASASNHGNNQLGRTYPAKHRNVISISASTGKGKDGQISPGPEDNDDNFMTLGIAVPLTWKGKGVYKSGTSYATPIAVGFAINALEFVGGAMGQEDFQQLKQSDEFMRRVFRLMSNRDSSRYSFLAPWLLWDGMRTPDFISHLLNQAMYH